jgi:iron-sulfur cluster repair protein YtfE (RIC family)
MQMEPINDYMMNDHREVDAILARSREAAGASDWAALKREGESFLARIERHIELEEDLLFPTFDRTTGMSGPGPSETMRSEHAEMQPIFARMRAAIESRDGAGYVRAAENLYEVLHPHNVKEEQMMYPMLDQALGKEAGAMVDELKRRALAP